jgi:hypothetical protein
MDSISITIQAPDGRSARQELGPGFGDADLESLVSRLGDEPEPFGPDDLESFSLDLHDRTLSDSAGPDDDRASAMIVTCGPGGLVSVGYIVRDAHTRSIRTRPSSPIRLAARAWKACTSRCPPGHLCRGRGRSRRFATSYVTIHSTLVSLGGIRGELATSWQRKRNAPGPSAGRS